VVESCSQFATGLIHGTIERRTEEVAVLISNSTIAWFGQFSRRGRLDGTVEDSNAFWKVPESSIVDAEKRIGFSFPNCYRQFLLEVGEGWLLADQTGGITNDYANSFLGPGRIADIVTKTSGEWLVYPEFIADGEFPFFDLGDVSVLVFDPKREECPVFRPFKFRRVATSFEVFLDKLRENCTFFVSAPS
jgi:hypothetical protein